MFICLSHWSALECWRAVRRSGDGLVELLLNERTAILPQGVAPSISKHEALDLAKHLGLTLPLQFSLPNSFERKPRDYCTFLRQRKAEPITSVCELEDGIYLPFPETVFLQLIKSLDAIDRAKLGYELVSSYCVDDDGKSLKSARSLIEFARLESVLLSCNRRTKELAQRAVDCFLPGAESPAEINLALKLFLPARYGGLGLKGAQLNPLLELSESSRALTGKTHCRGDIFFEAEKLDIEYDSSQWHATEQQRFEDMRRRIALRQDGYTVISINSQTSNSLEGIRELGLRIASMQGKRLVAPNCEFLERQRALFQRLGPTFAPVKRY